MRIVLHLLLLPILLSACSSVKMDTTENAKTLFIMKKGPCFGSCPVYDVEIRTDGVVLLQAKNFLDKDPGSYQMKLSEDTYKAFYKMVKESRINEADDVYDERIADASVITFTSFLDEEAKKVVYKFSAPDKIKAIATEIESWVTSDKGWKVIALKEQPQATHNKLLVTLDRRVDVPIWLKQYEVYGLKVERVLSPNGSIYLLDYNKGLDVNRVAEQLRRDKSVIEVKIENANNSKENKHGKIEIREGKKASDSSKDMGFETFEYESDGEIYKMKKYYLLTYLSAPNRNTLEKEESSALMEGHLQHLSNLAENKYACLAGPTDGKDEVRGFVLFSAFSEEQVKELTEQDPLVKAGQLTYTITPWWAAVGSELF